MNIQQTDQTNKLSVSVQRPPAKRIVISRLKMFQALVVITILMIISGFLIFTETAHIQTAEELKSDILINLPELGYLQGSTGKTAWTNKTILQFLSIPYAESPSSNLRFKPPVPKCGWKGIRDVSKYGRSCPEYSRFMKMNSEEQKENLEDCLSLCVFTKNIQSKLPVMVYIYGGGFINGSASDHPPNYLMEKDIVLVILQYRIGVLGYVSTKSPEIPGNMAVLDVMLALNWIQKNIQYFGGDSNSVTIFGQSAGSAIASLLTISPIVPKGLFHRAIIQSGSILGPWAVNQKPLETAKSICRQIGCFFCTKVEQINECLIEAPVESLLSISNGIKLTLDDFGGLIPIMPMQLMKNLSTTYPFMIGATKHDGSFGVTVFYDRVTEMIGNFNYLSPKQVIRLMIEKFDEPDSSGLVNNMITKLLFDKKDLRKEFLKRFIPEIIDLASDILFKSPVLSFTQLHSQNGFNRNYLYTFDYEGEHTRFGYENGNEHYPFKGGVHHSNDNLYLFPFPYQLGDLNAKDELMAKTMVDLWTSFAITGEPKTNGGPFLLPVTNGNGPYFRINEEITIGNDYLDEFFAATNDPNRDNLIR